jgi:hypothetical protein
MNYMKLNRIICICYVYILVRVRLVYKSISTEFVRRFNYKFYSQARIGKKTRFYNLPVNVRHCLVLQQYYSPQCPPKRKCLLP